MEPLYRQGYRTFLRVATAVVVEEARGADLVQEAFVRAIASRSSFRGDAPLEAWVWRIVLNSARAARPTGEARLPTTLAAATDTGSSEPDRYGVDAWLTALPERERLVVFLRYFAELDYRATSGSLSPSLSMDAAVLAALKGLGSRSLVAHTPWPERTSSESMASIANLLLGDATKSRRLSRTGDIGGEEMAW